MATTTIIKGPLEDHLGRILHPDTDADQVMLLNGITVEQQIAALLQKFVNYLPVTGGVVNGMLGTHNANIHISEWGRISVGTSGHVMIANNAYIHPTENTYHYANTHGSIGARGILLQNGAPGIMYFDTGHRATTADATFSPEFKPLTTKKTENYQATLDNISENTLVDCESVPNGPGDDWYYVQCICHSNDPVNYAVQIAYAFHSQDVKWRRKILGAWTSWEPFLLQSTTPAHYYSQAEPTAADGKDGDVWDVYK